MGNNVSSKEFEKFRDQLEKSFNDKARQELNEKCVKELAMRLLRKAIKRTPVGKKPEFLDDKGEQKALSTKVKVRGVNGTRTRSYLTKEGEILQKYWSGYSGGNLRRGWTGGKSENPVAYIGSKKIIRVGDKYYLHIFNTARYASYVEYGHRQKPGRYVPALGKRLKKGWVKGQFMLKSSEAEIKEIAPALLEQRLMEHLKKTMG
ncbi:HK97 gp10 family phage protein [Eubacteriaceae bacterium ES2]|nr:HK97 gp10 family phage protein [Eubacteriaceae bacterium ES2]